MECGGSAAFASTRAMALSIINLSDEYIKTKKTAEAAEARCRTLETENNALRAQAQRNNNAANNRQGNNNHPANQRRK